MGEEKQGEESLSIWEAKKQMVELYGAAKIPNRSLRTKYPELREADKASRDASKELREAIQSHPQLKERFDEISDSDASIPEKMKLWGPLFKEAEKIADLDEFRTKSDLAKALRVERCFEKRRTRRIG